MRSGRSVSIAGMLLLGLVVGCGPTSFLITPVTAHRALQEETIAREGFWAVDKIALIDVDGVIQNVAERALLGPAGENPVSLFAEKLRKAASDHRVKAVLLRINSPGGGVTATDLMYQELLRFKERTGKPVHAALLDVAASGGYYLACGAERIHAQPTTVTGSIGVIMLLPEFTGTMQKLGVTVNVVKSGAMKDMGSLFREMAADERALFQEIIDGMYARFVEVVARARPGIAEERVRELADGRVYLAAEAKEHGLVDEVGTLHEALAATRAAAGLADKPIRVVRYVRPLDYRPNIYARAAETPAEVNLINVELPQWLAGPAPQMLYLWAPGW